MGICELIYVGMDRQHFCTFEKTAVFYCIQHELVTSHLQPVKGTKDGNQLINLEYYQFRPLYRVTSNQHGRTHCEQYFFSFQQFLDQFIYRKSITLTKHNAALRR